MGGGNAVAYTTPKQRVSKKGQLNRATIYRCEFQRYRMEPEKVALAATLHARLGEVPNKPPPKAGFSYAAAARKAATEEERAKVEILIDNLATEQSEVGNEQAQEKVEQLEPNEKS
jgi:hypothetical protein